MYTQYTLNTNNTSSLLGISCLGHVLPPPPITPSKVKMKSMVNIYIIPLFACYMYPVKIYLLFWRRSDHKVVPISRNRK